MTGSEQGLSKEGKNDGVTQITPNIFATRHFTLNVDQPYSRSHYHLAMAEVKKQERDFTPEVNALLPETQTLSEVRDFAQSPRVYSLKCSPISLANFRKPWTSFSL